MPWTDITRRDGAREAARYASDLGNEEWALTAPLLPGPTLKGALKRIGTFALEIVRRSDGW